MRAAIFTLVPLLLALPSDGLLQWPQSLAEMKNLLHEAAGTLQSAFEAVQKAEEFVDAALEEDCPFSCPRKGQVPRPRKGHVKTR